ncbi:MAG: ATP-binding protein, partial [Anaerovorax sp.]
RTIFFRQQLETQCEYYEEFQEYNRELKKLRHDMKNQMQTIQMLIKQENYNAANECAERVLLETEKMNHFSFCEHEMLNALFFNMFKRINKEEIDFKYELYLPKRMNIEGLDICRLFSNILDNAIEGCKHVTDDKFIRIIANIVKENLIIKCENSCSKIFKIDERTGAFTSTKEEKGHGNGMPIMREIVEKYQGSIGFCHEQDRFILTAYLCLTV